MEKQTKTLYIFGVDGDYAEGAGTVAVLMGEGSQDDAQKFLEDMSFMYSRFLSPYVHHLDTWQVVTDLPDQVMDYFSYIE